MREDEQAAIVRQVWVWAVLHPQVTNYHAAGCPKFATAPGRPYFKIEKALQGCGFEDSGLDSPEWLRVWTWMYHTGERGA